MHCEPVAVVCVTWLLARLTPGATLSPPAALDPTWFTWHDGTLTRALYVAVRGDEDEGMGLDSYPSREHGELAVTEAFLCDHNRELRGPLTANLKHFPPFVSWPHYQAPHWRSGAR